MQKLAGVKFGRVDNLPLSYNFRREGQATYAISIGVTRFYLETSQWMSKVLLMIPTLRWKVLLEPFMVDLIMSNVERKVASGVGGTVFVTRRVELLDEPLFNRPVNFNSLERKVENG